MRRKEFRASASWALQFLQRARTIHFAGTTNSGRTVLRTVNPIVLEDFLYFHGSPKGEKTQCVGRPVVLQCEQVVATIPSYFVNPELACPATTYYQSVQVHGVLQAVHSPERKANVLSTLMRTYQPEGGYRPIEVGAAQYRAALAGIGVFGVELNELSGKSKLGQHKTPQQLQRIVEGLWQRGAPGDLSAMELILSENPLAAPPAFLRTPSGLRLCVSPSGAHAEQVAQILQGNYWTRNYLPEQRRDAHVGSTAWLVAMDGSGRCVASARGISDSARHAHLADVVVAPPWRGRGLGSALMRLLLDHPRLRHVTHITLRTLDAMPFYERFGFRPLPSATQTGPSEAQQPLSMVLTRQSRPT